MPATNDLLKLTTLYRDTEIEFPDLKPVTVAMWILESGWGTSDLCKSYSNFAGMKWRTAMKPFAKRIRYEAHDGAAYYCNFNSYQDFIAGFWVFLDRAPYEGWRAKADDPEAFIQFIGSIWAQDKNYAEKVIDLIGDGEDLLGAPEEHSHEDGAFCAHCGHGAETEKPTVNRWESTSHKSSRNNTDIDHIIIHYTTSRNIEGTISHFKHGARKASAHYIVGQDGALVQMVNDSDRAWHAGKSAMNARSIGIEHVAAVGDPITNPQAQTSIQLIQWLMDEYDIDKENIIPHNCVKSTSCCGELFKDFGGHGKANCKTQKKALDQWLSSFGI